MPSMLAALGAHDPAGKRTKLAARMRMIIEEDGAQSLGFFRGTGTFGDGGRRGPTSVEDPNGRRYVVFPIDPDDRRG